MLQTALHSPPSYVTMRALSTAFVFACFGAGAVPVALAQTAAPSFEIASVKPNPAGMGAPMSVRAENDRLTLVNVPGRQLVQMAFRDGARGRRWRAPGADPCGVLSMANAMIRGTVNLRGFPLQQLVVLASRDLGRPVVDETGLTGAFDWDLTFTPQNFVGKSFVRERFPSIDPDGPGLAAALEEQLGLKLQSRRSTLDVILIDHVERPPPD